MGCLRRVIIITYLTSAEATFSYFKTYTQNKKPEPGPEALSFLDLIRKVGNDTVASMRKDLAEGKLTVTKKKVPKGKKA